MFFDSFYLVVGVLEEDRIHVEDGFLFHVLLSLRVVLLFLANVAVQVALHRRQLLSLIKGCLHVNRQIFNSWLT